MYPEREREREREERGRERDCTQLAHHSGLALASDEEGALPRPQRGCALVDAKDRQWDRVCAFGDRCRRCAAALP